MWTARRKRAISHRTTVPGGRSRLQSMPIPPLAMFSASAPLKILLGLFGRFQYWE